MFILPDFGRDSDIDSGGNGFQHHRTGDALSRTTWMMALGPDVKQNVVVDRPRGIHRSHPDARRVLRLRRAALHRQGASRRWFEPCSRSNSPPIVSRGYPPEARQLAVSRIALLQRLPLAFLPLLLRELIVYDWKFPLERADLDRQFTYLGGLAATPFQAAMAAFAQLKLTRALEQIDWVNSPAVFSEQLSAHLWATHQIDSFRAAAVDYVQKATASAPDPPLATHRLGIAVIGQGVAKNDYRLFRNLRPQGMYFTQVRSRKRGGAAGCRSRAGRGASRALRPLVHRWRRCRAVPAGITRVSYDALSAPRAALQKPHAEDLRGGGLRSRGLSHHAGADQARRSRPRSGGDQVAQPFPTQSADGRIGNPGLLDHLRAMGGAGSAAPRATTDADRRATLRASARSR